ncbi:MAG: RNA 2',3'-cyclic phosphodiesterase [Gammaproteobacteria bacterium]|nr:RNA 2',3'-cyclic phosphodiesterase [Gammaproteobacteria bacterium]
MTGFPMHSEAPRPERQHRLFFALWPADDLRLALAPRIRALLPAGGGRPQRPDQWHVTLEFLGSVPASRVAAVREAAAQVRGGPCEIVFDAVEFWRRPEVLTLVARVLPSPLDSLVTQLRAALAARGFETESRPFRAHLTLARKVTHPVSPVAFEPLHWPAADFALVESITDRSGSVYTPLASWNLQSCGA